MKEKDPSPTNESTRTSRVRTTYPQTLNPHLTHPQKLFSRFLGERGPANASVVFETSASPLQEITALVLARGYPREALSQDNVLAAYESKYASKDINKAAEVLLYFLNASYNKISPITHNVPIANGETVRAYHKLLGADNRNAVTCYLDTLMFSMFARLNDFEPILKRSFPDSATLDNLSIFIRMYVNMLRDGKHITPDITKLLISALIKAGWESTGASAQQDCCELFNFITDALSMPMLTLKLEIAHEGLDSKEDDHKLVNERMLLITIPGKTGDEPILLEQCLESYFANSVQVFRQLQRRRTLDSNSQSGPPTPSRKRQLSICFSSREIPSSVVTRDSDDDDDDDEENSNNGDDQQSATRALLNRQLAAAADHGRANVRNSISSVISGSAPHGEQLPAYSSLYSHSDFATSAEKPSLSTLPPNSLWTPNKEFSLPAWMFLQLVPFYTNRERNTTPANPLGIAPATDTFAGARPVVAMCLKRSGWTEDNRPILNNREVIVPQVIHFPNFVADNKEEDEHQSEHTNTNGGDRFVLVLESAIFHRGASTNAGHFVAIARENKAIPYSEDLLSAAVRSKEEGEQAPAVLMQPSASRWIFFDDLKPVGEKVRKADFQKVFERENPYLLFYRLVSVVEFNREQLEGHLVPPPPPPPRYQWGPKSPIISPEPHAPIPQVAYPPTSPKTADQLSAEFDRPISRQLTPFDISDEVTSSEVHVSTVESDSSSAESANVIISPSLSASKIPDPSQHTLASSSDNSNMSKHLSFLEIPGMPSRDPDFISKLSLDEQPQDPKKAGKTKSVKRNKSLYKSWTSLRKSRTRPPSPVLESRGESPPRSFRKSLEANFGASQSPGFATPTPSKAKGWLSPQPQAQTAPTSPGVGSDHIASPLPGSTSRQQHTYDAPPPPFSPSLENQHLMAPLPPLPPHASAPQQARASAEYSRKSRESPRMLPLPTRIEDVKFTKSASRGFRKNKDKGKTVSASPLPPPPPPSRQVPLSPQQPASGASSTSSANVVTTVEIDSAASSINYGGAAASHHHYPHIHQLTPEEARHAQYRSEKCIIS